MIFPLRKLKDSSYIYIYTCIFGLGWGKKKVGIILNRRKCIRAKWRKLWKSILPQWCLLHSPRNRKQIAISKRSDEQFFNDTDVTKINNWSTNKASSSFTVLSYLRSSLYNFKYFFSVKRRKINNTIFKQNLLEYKTLKHSCLDCASSVDLEKKFSYKEERK